MLGLIAIKWNRIQLITLSTSGFTMLFTTSMQEEDIVADNDPQAKILMLSLFIKQRHEPTSVFNTQNNAQL